MFTARHTYHLTHEGETYSVTVDRMNATESEVVRASNSDDARFREILARHVVETTITIDGQAYPSDQLERAKWWGWFSGPLLWVAIGAYRAVLGLDSVPIPPGN